MRRRTHLLHRRATILRRPNRTSLLTAFPYRNSPSQTMRCANSRLARSQLTRFDQDPDLKRITVSCWDFAGQEVYALTHQFFLTPQSIYLIAFNMCWEENAIGTLPPCFGAARKHLLTDTQDADTGHTHKHNCVHTRLSRVGPHSLTPLQQSRP